MNATHPLRFAPLSLAMAIGAAFWFFGSYRERPAGKDLPGVARVAVAASPSGTHLRLHSCSASNKISPPSSAWSREEWVALARRDPETALRRIERIADRHDQRYLAAPVCLAIADRDPPLALRSAWRFGLGLLAEDARENAALATIAERWARADIDGALVWASTLPADEGGRRDLVFEGLAQAIATEAPAVAASLINEFISPDTGAQFGAMVAILRRAAAHDHDVALRLLACFPDGPLQDQGLQLLATLPPPPPSAEEG